jgi:hypothetical protein
MGTDGGGEQEPKPAPVQPPTPPSTGAKVLAGGLVGFVVVSAVVLGCFLLLILKGASDRTDRAVRDAVSDGGKDANTMANPAGRDITVLTDWGWWLATLVVLALKAVLTPR